MTTLAFTGIVGAMMHATGFLPRVRNRKVGGIRFLRIGRYQFSFCRCKGSL
jgi:hypothetical protein